MIHSQRTFVIDASPEKVWPILSRFMHIDEFAPLVKSVDALTVGETGVGSKRRCHFKDGNSLVEEVTHWQVNRGYRVRLSDTDPMPLKEAYAELSIAPQGTGQTKVVWSMDYRVKYGPIGWLLGQKMMKRMMGKILDGNLKGLANQVASLQSGNVQATG
ncbi:MAG: SRPBCC family protein [Roseibium sp.]|uniref:SRPBCC family protein n=1 Tax=Roseibium sp. TaxID=1936156 RepID=UPI002614D0DE|nr:SRPBCC family protein [Roseibium sp.]MCV0428479.1 SRPBCC family protein [Roseibium sp.]